MRVLAVLEGNLVVVVVEPRLKTMLRHANVDSWCAVVIVTLYMLQLIFGFS